MHAQRIVQRHTPAHQLTERYSPLLQRLLANRGVLSDSQFDFSLANLPCVDLLKGIQPAIDRLVHALLQQQHITVVGDFDADGATSTALLLRALKFMGFSQLSFQVPNRFEYGYGLSIKVVEELCEQDALKPDVIVTVDNGISSIDGVASANQHGIDVLITDHHLPGDLLPEACAIVNPNQPDCRFPAKNTAGVGVVFYLLIALRKRLQTMGWFEDQQIPLPNLAQHLDLVALGTVADVVPLDYYNRILVQQGIQRMRAGRMCAGVAALMSVSAKQQQAISAKDLGFSLAPRLNAAGRLEDMTQGVVMLLTDSHELAFEIATQMDGLNKQRREWQMQMQAQALAMVDKLAVADASHHGLCVYHPQWHEGIVGLVASKLKETYHCPVIAFAKTDDGYLKGSGRSISSIHIRDLLESIANSYPSVVSHFGGHAMAAGLVIAEHHWLTFKNAFEHALAQLPASLFEKVLQTDGKLDEKSLNLLTADQLKQQCPWGQGFPEPLFEGSFYVVKTHWLTQGHLKCELSLAAEHTNRFDAIYFNVPEAVKLNAIEEQSIMRCLYRLDSNTFRGHTNLQLVIEQII